MLGKKIHRFKIDGLFKDDKYLQRIKRQFSKLLEEDFRERGYIRVLDLDEYFMVEYDHDKEEYSFQLTVYAVYVGKRKAKIWTGISNSGLIRV